MSLAETEVEPARKPAMQNTIRFGCSLQILMFGPKRGVSLKPDRNPAGVLSKAGSSNPATHETQGSLNSRS